MPQLPAFGNGTGKICWNCYELAHSDCFQAVETGLYLEIVSTLENNKLFILLSLRNYITDQDLEGFLDSVLLHGYNIFMIETCDHK